MVVAKYLFERYPDQNEGFLSMMRTKIVNGKMLGSLGKKIGFDKFVLISKQIEEAGGRTNYKTLEDVFEAFIAAIYLDYQSDEDMPTMPSTLSALIPLSGSGFHMAETWIVTILEKYIDFVELIQTQTNYKDMLSKYMQNNLKDMPRFYEVNIDKRNQKNNSSVFTYCVKDKSGAVIGTAKGTSKKDAENNAALVALEYYGQNL
jgi:ribonuclease-3